MLRQFVRTKQFFHIFVPSKVSFLTFISSSVNGYFGSGIMTKTGILLNNEMLDFSIPGVQRVVGAGPPKVRINIRYYSSLSGL